MTKTAMTATNFIKLAKLLPSNVSILVRGDHGIGKSQIISQIADYVRTNEYEGKDLPFYDMRLSQCESGDLIGVPWTDGIVTEFKPPPWLKNACDAPAVIFLDELNRATPEVMQAAFQLVLDRKLGANVLHPETRVYAAVNTGASYVVNEMDPALLDRFWTVDLEPSPEEWLSWAKESGEVCGFILDFIRTNPKFLDPPKDTEPGSVSTSRRSWHRLSRALTKAGLDQLPDDPKDLDPTVYTLSLGFIGVESSIAFVDFVKNMDRQITGEDVLNKLVKKLGKCDAKQIGREGNDDNGKPFDDTVYDDKFVQKINDLGQERQVGLVEKVVDAMKTIAKEKKLSPKQCSAAGKFISIIPAELRISFWSKIAEDGQNNIELIKSIHKHIVRHILSVFNVSLEGNGSQEPQIPDFLKNAS